MRFGVRLASTTALAVAVASASPRRVGAALRPRGSRGAGLGSASSSTRLAPYRAACASATPSELPGLERRCPRRRRHCRGSRSRRVAARRRHPRSRVARARRRRARRAPARRRRSPAHRDAQADPRRGRNAPPRQGGRAGPAHGRGSPPCRDRSRPGIGELRGRVVIVDFWATWCMACRMSAPKLTSWQAKFGAQGLSVIGITDDPVAQASQGAQRFRDAYAAVGYGRVVRDAARFRRARAADGVRHRQAGRHSRRFGRFRSAQRSQIEALLGASWRNRAP